MSKKKDSFKDKITSTKVLTIVFLLLVVFVLILGGFLVYKRVTRKPDANMFIAILNKEKRYSFHINSDGLAEDYYLLKITNYRGPNVLDKDINYTITISNPTENILSVKRLEDFKEIGNELMVNQESTKIEKQNLKKNKKNEIWYKLSFSKVNKEKDNDLISVVIES